MFCTTYKRFYMLCQCQNFTQFWFDIFYAYTKQHFQNAEISMIRSLQMTKNIWKTIKGNLDKYTNIIPNFFQKKSWDFYTIRSVGMGKDCMLSFMF